MLRTLGVAFIICGVCFAGFTCLGIGFWAIHSGFVVFPALQRTAVSDHTTGLPSINEMTEELPGPSDTEHRDAVLTETRSSTRIRTAGFTTLPAGPSAAVDLNATAGERDLASILSQSRLNAVRSSDGSAARILWDLAGNSPSSPLLFPADTTLVEMDFTVPGLTNELIDHLKTTPSDNDDIVNRTLLSGGADIVGSGEILTIQYNLSREEFADGVREIGLSHSRSTRVHVQKLTAAGSGQLKVLYTFNGPRQTGNPPPEYASGSVPLFGSYLRVRYFSPDDVEPWFFIVDDSIFNDTTANARRVHPARNRLPAAHNYEALFTSPEQLFDLSIRGNGRLYIAIPETSASGSRQVFFAEAVKLRRGIPTSAPSAPSITITDANPIGGVFYIGTGSTTASIGNLPTGAGNEQLDVFL